MTETRELTSVEKAKIQEFLHLERAQIRVALFALGPVTLVYPILFFLGGQPSVEFLIALSLLYLMFIGLTIFFWRMYGPFTHEFGPVRPVTGKISWRYYRGSTNYFINQSPVKIPPLWNCDSRFNDGQSITALVTTVKYLKPGKPVRVMDFAVEIPGFQSLASQGWSPK